MVEQKGRGQCSAIMLWTSTNPSAGQHSDWSAAGHLVSAGEGGAERLDLRWEESARSVECERV